MTAPIEVSLREPQRREVADILLAEHRELVEQALQRSSRRRLELREAVERLERLGVAVLENHPRPRHPVRALAVNQVANDVEGAPRVGALVCRDPALGK